jgi:hypothetical protein
MHSLRPQLFLLRFSNDDNALAQDQKPACYPVFGFRWPSALIVQIELECPHTNFLQIGLIILEWKKQFAKLFVNKNSATSAGCFIDFEICGQGANKRLLGDKF